MIRVFKVGFQFKTIAACDQALIDLRKKVKLANALREYEGTDKFVARNTSYSGSRRFRVEVYYRLGRNNPHASYYRGRRGHVRIKKEHAEYASVYVRDSIVWKNN